METNPYAPTANAAATPDKPRWLRRTVALNVILLALPIVLVTVELLALSVLVAMEAAQPGADPVTYQHSVWVVGPGWGWWIPYFLIPNAILFACYRVSTVTGVRRLPDR